MSTHEPPQRRETARPSAPADQAPATPVEAGAAPPDPPAPASAQAGPEPLPAPDFGYAPPERYDPADYRWVPVRRVPRRDGWTEEKQRRFIEVLADTGLVSQAARAVGMSREAAYRLRRAPYARAFARAWDLARERAGALVEDIAFERALEGVETEIYDSQGALTGSKTVYNDRLLCFLLRHLKPERYGTVTGMHGGGPPQPPARGDGPPPATPATTLAAASDAAPDSACDAQPELPSPTCGAGSAPATLDEALRAMEPPLPAPAEDLLDPDTLYDERQIAEIADGKLPHFLAEQGPPKSPERERAEYLAALCERGAAIDEAIEAGRMPDLSEEDLAAYCLAFDPAQAGEVPRKWRQRKDGAGW